MNLTEEINRINELNFFFLKEQTFNNSISKKSLVSTDISIEGPYELGDDNRVYNLGKELSVKKNENLKIIFRIRNNYPEVVTIKSVNITGDGFKNSTLSSKTIKPNDFEQLTLNIGAIEMQYWKKEGGIGGGLTSDKKFPENQILMSKISGDIVIEGPKLSSGTLPIGSLANQNTLLKKLPTFTVKVLQTNVGVPLKKIKPASETINWISTWDTHDWLNFLELAATALAFFSPVGWVALASSTLALTFGGINAKLYFDEGDNYMGGMTVFFSLIPGAQLAKTFTTISKNGVKTTFEALKAVKAGTASEAQERIAKEFAEEMGKKGKVANNLLQAAIRKKILENLIQQPTKTIVGALVYLGKLGFKIAGLGVIFAGSLYSWDVVYGLLGKNEDEIEEKSIIRKLWRWLNENPEEIREQSIESLKNTWDNIPKDSLGTIDFEAGLRELSFEDNKFTKIKDK